jgi:hypothetical protein
MRLDRIGLSFRGVREYMVVSEGARRLSATHTAVRFASYFVAKGGVS